MSRRNKENTKGQSAPAMTTDAFSNSLFRLGFGSQAPIEATQYPLTRMTDNYALLNSLYRDNWVVQNVVDIVPGDMLREWFTLSGDIAPDRMAVFERLCRASKLRDRLMTGLCWGRLYGGAAGLILIKGQEDLSQPLDLGAVLPGAYQGLYILDRWTGITPGAELVDNPSDLDFNLPMWYDINDTNGRAVTRVHHSRVVRFTGRELPYLEQVAELYWGESEIEAIFEDIKKHDNVSHNMANLTFRANLDVTTVENLNQLLSVGGTEQQKRVWAAIQAQSVIRSNFGMQLLNRGDTLQNFQYTFTGLKDIYDSMCLDLSGASRIPVTKLFGRSPAGMNATGESDLKNYYDYVDNLRESKLRPILERLLPVLLASAWGEVPDDVDIQFPPLWTPTAKEVSEIARAKTETIIAAFQAGLMDKAESMRELKKLSDETGLFDSIADESIAASEGLTYQDVTSLKDPFAGIEESRPFDVAATDELTVDAYNPNQPRDKNGRWTGVGSGKALKKSSHRGKMSKKERDRVSHEILTWHPEYKPGEIHSHFHGKYYYWFTVEEPGTYRFSTKMKISGNERTIDQWEERLKWRK